MGGSALGSLGLSGVAFTGATSPEIEPLTPQSWLTDRVLLGSQADSVA